MFKPLVQTQTPHPVNTSARRRRARLVVLSALMVTALAALAPARADAETQAKTFGFGPGTNRPASGNDSVTLTVPARTSVKISGVLNPVADIPFPVVIEVFQPGAASPIASLPWVAAPASFPFMFGVETVTGGFTSQVGCPSSWTVRVRTADNAVPPKAVSGSVTFDFQRPARVNLDMVGDPVSVAVGDEKKVNLAGHDTLGVANPTLIAGRGRFTIKAKWDTDPADVWHFGRFYKVRVALLRPDGTFANGETAFSQHRGDNYTRVNFVYDVTQADAAMTGSWKVRIRNTVNGGRARIVNFDVENLAFPSFNSTFQARCN